MTPSNDEDDDNSFLMMGSPVHPSSEDAVLMDGDEEIVEVMPSESFQAVQGANPAHRAPILIQPFNLPGHPPPALSAPQQQEQFPATSVFPPLADAQHIPPELRSSIRRPAFFSVQNDTDVLEIPEEPRKRPRLGLDSALREDDRVSACTSKVPSSNRGPPVQDHSSDSGADECIICMDPIMSHGDHRAACLICGHIFGQKCIEKWVKSTDKEKRVCPQCKTPAKLADIRTLFTSKQVLCVVDNSEMDGVRKDLIAARKELNAVKEQLNSMAREQHMSNIRTNEKSEENRRLAKEAADLKLLVEEYKRQLGIIGGGSGMPAVSSNMTTAPPQTQHKANYRLFLDLVREYKDASARVMAFYPHRTVLVISQKLNTTSHGPFGKGSALKMVSCVDFNTTETFHVPTGIIRDISVNNSNGTAIVGSLDKTIAIVSLNQKSIIHKYQDEQPVWSCAWNTNDTRYFYCGLADGSVSVYDIRQLSERVCRLSPGGPQGGPPAFQVTYVDSRPGHKFPHSGLLVSSANRSGFYTATQADMTPQEYCDFGQIGSQFAMTYDWSTRMIARSYRPDSTCKVIRHHLEELNYTAEGNPRIQVNALHNVARGSKAVSMYRGAFLSVGERPDEMELRLAMPDEAQKSVLLWDLMDKNPKQELKLNQMALDLCPFVVNGKPLTAVLMEKGLQVYSSRAVM